MHESQNCQNCGEIEKCNEGLEDSIRMKKEETQRNRKEDMHNMDETIKELQKKLDWYTDEATEEEFDAKEVEAILYLLDKWVPIDEEQIPDVDEAWQNFQKRISETEVSAPE